MELWDLLWDPAAPRLRDVPPGFCPARGEETKSHLEMSSWATRNVVSCPRFLHPEPLVDLSVGSWEIRKESRIFPQLQALVLLPLDSAAWLVVGLFQAWNSHGYLLFHQAHILFFWVENLRDELQPADVSAPRGSWRWLRIKPWILVHFHGWAALESSWENRVGMAGGAGKPLG